MEGLNIGKAVWESTPDKFLLFDYIFIYYRNTEIETDIKLLKRILEVRNLKFYSKRDFNKIKSKVDNPLDSTNIENTILKLYKTYKCKICGKLTYRLTHLCESCETKDNKEAILHIIHMGFDIQRAYDITIQKYILKIMDMLIKCKLVKKCDYDMNKYVTTHNYSDLVEYIYYKTQVLELVRDYNNYLAKLTI